MRDREVRRLAQPAAQRLEPSRVHLVVYEQLLMVDAADGEQSGGADPLAARDIGAQRIADAQQLRWLEVAVRKDAPVDGGVRLAEPEHWGAQDLVALRNRRGRGYVGA